MKKKLNLFLALFTLLYMSQPVYARRTRHSKRSNPAARVSRAPSEAKIADISHGLCTDENKKETQVSKGYCQIISNLLNHEECFRTKLAELTDVKDAGEFCGGFAKIQNDISTKAFVVQNLLAAMAKQESDWRKDAGGNVSGGIFQIKLGDRDAKPYACGCQGMTDIKNPEQNIKCGAYIALYWMVKDHRFAGTSNDNSGAGRYFGSMRSASQRPERVAIAEATKRYCVARGIEDLTPNRQIASLDEPKIVSTSALIGN